MENPEKFITVRIPLDDAEELAHFRLDRWHDYAHEAAGRLKGQIGRQVDRREETRRLLKDLEIHRNRRQAIVDRLEELREEMENDR